MMTVDKRLEVVGKTRGAYVLVIRLDRPKRMKVGRLDIVSFKPGYYLYTGSALGSGGLSGRISRHLRQETRKRSHWHIDALTSRGVVDEVWWLESPRRLECTWAEILAQVGDRSLPGFGASDCRCTGHLVWLHDAEGVERAWNVLREHIGSRLHRAKITNSSLERSLASGGEAP